MSYQHLYGEKYLDTQAQCTKTKRQGEPTICPHRLHGFCAYKKAYCLYQFFPIVFEKDLPKRVSV